MGYFSYKKIVLYFSFFFFNTVIFAQELLENEKNTIEVFEKVSPYVVYVNTIKKVIDYNFDMFEVMAGTGSGFFWDEKGYIVTNYHVISGAERVAISFDLGKTFPVKIIGFDPKKDIAVLKLEDKKGITQLPIKSSLDFANSSKLRVGAKTMAIGNPFGLTRTLTTGVISALGREIPGFGGVTIKGMIQTDAFINPGNSGGILVNSKGELIGMNTMMYSRTDSFTGIGFAVPIYEIKRVVDQIIKYGRPIQPGIGFHKIDDNIAYQLGIRGIIVQKIIPNSPADRAGLKGTIRDEYGRIHLGDIIVSVDGKDIENYDDFYQILEKKKVGERIKLVFLRNSVKKTVDIQLVDLTDLQAQ